MTDNRHRLHQFSCGALCAGCGQMSSTIWAENYKDAAAGRGLCERCEHVRGTQIRQAKATTAVREDVERVGAPADEVRELQGSRKARRARATETDGQ